MVPIRSLIRAAVCSLVSSVALQAQLPVPPGSAVPPRKQAAEGLPAYVIEQQVIRLRFENDGTMRRDAALRVKVLDEQAVRAWGQLPFTYNSDSEELTVSQIDVQKADGSIVKTDPATMQDVAVRPFPQLPIFMDLRQKVPTIASLRPGDVLSLKATWSTKRPTIPGQFVYAHRFNRAERIDDDRLEIDVPADRQVNLKFGPEAPSEITGGRGNTAGDRRVYAWKTQNTKVNSAAENEAEGEREAAAADIRLTTFKTWEDVGRWYRSILPGGTDARVAAKASELTAGLRDRNARLAAIYNYVSTQIRYVSLSFGLGRYAPHQPADVLSNQYGDCKDKGVLLTALLAAAGIDSAPVLVSTTRSADVDFPSPLEFDHLITMVPGDAGAPPQWLDTTLEVAPAGLLSEPVRDRRALLIGPASRIVATPADPPFESLQRIEIAGKVHPLGWLDAKVTLTARGDSELVMRSMLRALPKDSWADFGKGLAQGLKLEGEVSGFETSDPADTRDPFRVNFQLHRRKYLDWAAATSETEVAAMEIGLGGWTEEQRRNRTRVQLGAPGRMQAVTTIEFPAGYELRPPVDVVRNSEDASYSATYRVEGTRLLAERTLRNSTRELPAERFGAYAAFISAVEADAGQKIKIRAQGTTTPALPEGVASLDAYDAALSAYNARKYEAATALWKRATEIDPKFGDAWVSLGLAYDQLRRYDEAAAAIQKQIDLDPYNKRAYGDLGHVLGNAKKREGAAGAYARHVELNPLDGAAFKKLGNLYMELGRYSDVIPAFEKALALGKPDAWTTVLLGQSYLYTQQRENGLKAFDRALELDPTPAVMTRMAWVLAETGHEPARARDLAQRVIRRASDDMQSTSISALRNRELDLVERLAWAWDTLALLELQGGSLPVAEKYAHAAWLLLGQGTMAEHVGRIYDKQGRGAEAVNYFAVARLRQSKPPAVVMERTRSLGEGELEKIVRATELHRLAMIEDKTVSGQAQFVALVGPDRKASAVRYVRGDAALAPLTAALKRVNYPVAFPDASTTRLLVPLEVRCVSAQGCMARIVHPDDVDLNQAEQK